jgi:hypothetical protein
MTNTDNGRIFASHHLNPLHLYGLTAHWPRNTDGSLPTVPTSGDGPPTMSYKVDELMALRDSVSESAVSLDKFSDEEVIRGQ